MKLLFAILTWMLAFAILGGFLYLLFQLIILLSPVLLFLALIIFISYLAGMLRGRR